jgi:hypothetical protein
MPSLLIQGTNRVLVIGIELLGPGAAERQAGFCFHPTSTDQVPGSSGPVGSFSETTPQQAAQPLFRQQDRQRPLLRAWLHAFGLLLVSFKAVCGEQIALYGVDHRERINRQVIEALAATDDWYLANLNWRAQDRQWAGYGGERIGVRG